MGKFWRGAFEGATFMVILQRLNGKEISINEDLIESIEAAPDTVITLTTGNRYVVKNTVEDTTERIIAFKRKVFVGKGLKGEGE